MDTWQSLLLFAETPQQNIIAKEKAKEMNAATLLSGFHDGLILRNTGDYLSFFEVSQFLITCKYWRQVFKSKETAIQMFWKRVGKKVMRSKICHSLQDILTHQLYLKLNRNPEIIDRCNVLLNIGESNYGSFSISIVTKSNFNDIKRRRLE
jgi:hypothetical protein